MALIDSDTGCTGGGKSIDA